MNNQEAIEMLTAKAECIRREASGIDVDCNHRNCDECDLCYKQGTMGDQMEALGMAISALEKQIPMELGSKVLDYLCKARTECGNCGEVIENAMWDYCPWCGQRIGVEG